MSENRHIMFNLFFVLIVAAFVAMLFVNVIYRVRIFKLYKYLVQNKVQFGTSHFFSRDKMEKEVISRYPTHEKEIREFVKMIQNSVQLASVLILIIIALGYLLLKFR